MVKEFLSNIWLQKALADNSHLLLHCTIQSFPISTCALGTMTSADISQLIVTTYFYARPRDLLGYEGINFPFYIALSYMIPAIRAR